MRERREGQGASSGRQRVVQGEGVEVGSGGWAWWQKAAFGVAVVCLAVGFGLQVWTWLSGGSKAGAPGRAPTTTLARASLEEGAGGSGEPVAPSNAKRGDRLHGVRGLMPAPSDVIRAVQAPVGSSLTSSAVGAASAVFPQREPPIASARFQGAAEPAPSPVAEPGVAEKAAPILTESGIMFFVGFCIGAAIRAIAKTLIVLLGLVFLGVVLLQYFGVIATVDWHALGDLLRTAATWAQRGAERLQDVLAHTLPSGTMAGLGLATGLRRS